MSPASNDDPSYDVEGCQDEHGIVGWDEHYDSPKNDLILISKEKTGFRVDAWTLAKKSQFIKDLLQIPSGEPLENAPLVLDEPASAMRYFLDVALSGGIPIARSHLQQCGDIIKLCERFQAASVLEAISKAMQIALRDHKTADVDAWEIFKMAAKLNDEALAKEAIKRFDVDKINANLLFFDNVSLDLYDGVPARFALALMRSTRTWAHWYGKHFSPGQRHYVPNTPSEMAEKFNLE